MEKNHIIEPISSEDAEGFATFINEIGTLGNKINNSEDTEQDIQQIFSETQSAFDFMKNLARSSIKEDKKTLQSKYMPLMNELYPSLKQELEDVVKNYESQIKLFTERVNLLEKQMNSTVENNEHLKTTLLTLKKNISTQKVENLENDVKLDEKLKVMEKISRLDEFFPGLLNKKYSAEIYKKGADAFAELIDFIGENLKSFMLPFVEKAKSKFKIDDPNGKITGESLKKCMNAMVADMESAYKEYVQHILRHPEILDNAFSKLQNNLLQLFPKDKEIIHQSIVKNCENTLEKMLQRKPTAQECERILKKTNAEFEQVRQSQNLQANDKNSENNSHNTEIDPKLQKYAIYRGDGQKIEGELLIKIKQNLTKNKTTDPVLREALGNRSIVKYVNYIADIQTEKEDMQSHIRGELKNSEIKGGGILIRYKIHSQEKSVIVGMSL